MMKLRLLAIAAGLVAASGAHALTPTQIAASRAAGTLKEVSFSGASALRLTFGAYAAEICDTATLHVYFNGALPVEPTDGVNHRAYACKLKAAVGGYGINTDVVIYKRDQSGSTAGANPIATNEAMEHMRIVDDATCAATPNPVFSDTLVPNYLCSGVQLRVSDAGISDVEPAVLNQAPNLTDKTAGKPSTGSVSAVDMSNLVTNSFVQAIFGVAVNKQAYLALQKTQFPALAGATTVDESDAFRPSLPTSFIRGFLTGGLSASATTKRGWGLVISEAADGSVNTKAFNICRRQPGSGTQAASNLYFANAPCGGATAASPLRQSGDTSPLPAVTGSYIVNEQSGSGGVLNCLKAVEALPGAYGLAVIGRENNPLANGALPGSAGDGGYRYVKIDGMQPVRYDAATGKGAVTGDYDFVYESTLQYNSTNAALDADKLSFINAVRVNAPKPASLRVLDVDVQQGVASPSGAWAAQGQYPALSLNFPLDKPFASRVARLAGQSCTTLKFVR